MKYGESSKFKLVDLFSGCGGMTLGFFATGRFSPVFANDWDSSALNSYKLNFDPRSEHSISGDIVSLVDDPGISFPKADVVIGGPPCQGFSLLNKKRQGDSRRSLWLQFMHVVQQSEAKVVVMENVRQLLTSSEFSEIKEAFSDLGFNHVEANVLNTANYGVAEKRFRTIIMASRTGPVSLPRPVFFDPKQIEKLKDQSDLFSGELKPWRTVRDAIGDLPPPQGTEIRNLDSPLDLHFGRNPTAVSMERYKTIPAGGNRFDLQRERPDITPGCWIRKKTGGTDLMGRLWWDRPSVTIRTEFYKPEKGRYLHPEQNRPITHREAARIQSFPDSFKFSGTKVEIARQIGNAVPPLMAEAIARQVIASLEQRTSTGYVMETRAEYEYL